MEMLSSMAVGEVSSVDNGNVPRLVTPLRLALAQLYHLPSSIHNHPTPTHHMHRADHAPDARIFSLADANAYLVEFQSRNSRRRVTSLHQRQRDRAGHHPDTKEEEEEKEEETDAIVGSTWLAALHVLALSTAHATERLFCAQTLLHRLRRMKLEDAMDVDMEEYGCGNFGNNTVVDTLVGLPTEDDPQRHAAALQHLHSRTAHQLMASLPQHSHLLQPLFLQSQQQQTIRGEDQIKGELGIMTLAVLAVETAHAEYSPSQHSQQHPQPQQHAIFSSMLATLGAAMAAMALRLHAPSNNETHHGNHNSPTNAIVPMVTRTIQTVILHVQPQQHALSASIQQQQQHTLANNACVCACLAAIPDTLLGCPGGARGRLSIDPKSLQAVNLELRTRATGVDLLLQTLTSLPLPPSDASSASTTASFHQVVLGACERWAKFVPLPMDFVNQISPMAAQYLTSTIHPNTSNSSSTTLVQRTASMFFVTLFESATVTVSEALAASVGLAAPGVGGDLQGTRKRQSSKSKKRHKERLQHAIEDNAADRLLAAQAECMERGRVACRAAILSWDGIQSLATQALSMNTTATSGFGSGGGEEGPIACLCTCAMACLPHMIRTEQNNNHTTTSLPQQQPPQEEEEQLQQQQKALFEAILTKLCQVCASSDRSVRSLSYEPLSAIHSALAERPITSVNTTLTPLEVTALHHVHQCVMSLAGECAYPQGYFANLTINNDEELEIERNDVRDIIRTLSYPDSIADSGVDTVSAGPCVSSLQILETLVHNIHYAISIQCADRLPPEPAVHTLSALAKPLNRLGELLCLNQVPLESSCETIGKALQALHDVCSQLIQKFASSPSSTSELLPISRLSCLATASLSPLFATLAQALHNGPNNAVIQTLAEAFEKTLEKSIHAAALSLAHIAELSAESSLGETQYDVRGAMRAPGGEDHVGCLALMRLAFESDLLAGAILSISSYGGGSSFVLEMCHLHAQLKRIELERGAGTFHGRGVCPKSRRILLHVISHFASILLNGNSHNPSMMDPTMIQSVSLKIQELFYEPLSVILDASSGKSTSNEAEQYYQICEACFDLGSFSSDVVSTLFDRASATETDDSLRIKGLRALAEASLSGYKNLISRPDVDDACLQWGRLRAALVTLFRSAGSKNGLPPLAVEMIIALNHAECEALNIQCEGGLATMSSIFHESVIGEESIPAGAFVMVLGEILARMSKKSNTSKVMSEQEIEYYQGCVLALHGSKDAVLRSIMHPCPEPELHGGFIDPRPTLAEAWYFSLQSLALISFPHTVTETSSKLRENQLVKELIQDSISAAVLLMFMPPIDKEKSPRSEMVGMSLDGPHTLALLSFLEVALQSGPQYFMATGQQLETKMALDNAILSSAGTMGSTSLAGCSVVAAGFIRATSGSLPPWAVESVPELFSGLFAACGHDCDFFFHILRISVNMRFASTHGGGYGSLRVGEKLSGRYFQKMSDTGQAQFLESAKEACTKNDITTWRRFKTVLKKACGGKKKGSGFSLKPTKTTWDCDRL